MPFGDGTGPAGLGPMTGRGAGYCAGYPVPGYMNPIPGRGYGGFGRGMGLGRGGFGRGRGFGRGFRGLGWGYPMYGGYPYGVPYAGAAYGAPYAPAYPAYGYPNSGYAPTTGYAPTVSPYAPNLTPNQEADMLKAEAKAIQEDLKSINSRIAELEKASKEAK